VVNSACRKHALCRKAFDGGEVLIATFVVASAFAGWDSKASGAAIETGFDVCA
jgi:hypothetical protein